MRRFLASGWYPFLSALLLAGATAGAFVFLAPQSATIGQSTMEQFAPMAGWAIGPVSGLLTLILIGILNLVRRIAGLRRVQWLHPIVVLLSIGTFIVFAWTLTSEPLYTPIARMLVEFCARPLLLGSIVAFLVALILGIPAFLPSRK